MPYRTAAEMPKEEIEMSEKEVQLKIWKMVLTTVVAGTALISGCNIVTTIQSNQTSLLKAQVESTPLARDAAQARYLEAKALSDRAMFEEMSKHPAK
jgi:outer membrane murein-binding lipoprotein Lpp